MMPIDDSATNPLRRPQPDLAIRTTADQPRFRRVPPQIQHAQPIRNLMPTQHLERYDERVLHQVAVHGPVEDLDGAVVGCRGKERVGPVVCDGTEGLGVVPAPGSAIRST
jgi:hypothetical protein